MLRSLMLAGVTLISAASLVFGDDIRPKTPDTAFSGKLRPDIIGVSSDDDAAKVGGVFETYLKDFPNAKPQATQQKFGNTDVTYATAMKFDSPAGDAHGAESMEARFTSPASGNVAYYITRDLGFAKDKQPTLQDMIQRVIDKYGKPTAIGDGRLYYFYKGGKIVSVKQKYTPESAVAALNQPINPKAAVALNDANGRGSCVAVLKHVLAEPQKSLDRLARDAKTANCDGIVDVALPSGHATDRVGKAIFTLIDFKRIASAAKIDADALAAGKAAPQKTSSSTAPRL
jgi:hypothetical protein